MRTSQQQKKKHKNITIHIKYDTYFQALTTVQEINAKHNEKTQLRKKEIKTQQKKTHTTFKITTKADKQNNTRTTSK